MNNTNREADLINGEEFDLINDNIKSLEKTVLNKEKIDEEEIDSLERKIEELNHGEQRTAFKKRVIKIKKKEKQLKEWDILVEEVNVNSKAPLTKELVNAINEVIDETISNDEIDEIQNIYLKAMDEIYTEFNLFDSEFVLNCINKKIKIFQNRVARLSNKDFGGWISDLRKERGLTLKELELSTGVSSSYIYRLERNPKQAPSFAIIEKIANGTNTPIEDLLAMINTDIREDIELSVLMKNAETVKYGSYQLTKDEIVLLREFIENNIVSKSK
ncbi:MAG: helix-turn-helix transcriptional regulator [Peptostreptococcaceae bacterium]